MGHYLSLGLRELHTTIWMLVIFCGVNRLGGSQVDAKSWSLLNDPKDSKADQNAIQDGWFYDEGFQDAKDCPQNR
jgi:hypothetical protein